MSEDAPPPPPPPPALEFPVIPVWPQNQKDVSNANNLYEFRYVVSQPWAWVMDQVKTDSMTDVENPILLPLAIQQEQQQQQQSASTPTSNPNTPLPRRSLRQRRDAQRKNKAQVRATLRIEVVDRATERVVVAWHGTSSGFDGLEDKDALVRTIQRCRVETLHLSPPSVLINWDVSLDECRNVVGRSLPVVVDKTNDEEELSSSDSSFYAVLKEPMGSAGQGIYFVKDTDEIHRIIDEHHQRARAEPDVLESLIAAKNRIPSWVLQAEVSPCMLIRDGRKFHIRSYVVLVERPENDEVLDLYLYHQHEVRIAGVSVNQDTNERDPLAHITNGALSEATERTILSQEPELAPLQSSLDVFIAQTFAKHLLTDISRRVTSNPAPTTNTREFAVAGLDLMVTTSGRWYLLEVNVNPAAPTEPMTSPTFKEHLQTFWKDLVNLVSGQSTHGFHDAFVILERAGITEG